MNVELLLADSAQVAGDGKLYALGVGWSRISTPTPPLAIIIMLDLTPEEAQDRHSLVIELLDQDGAPVQVVDDAGELGEPLRIDAAVRAQPSADLIAGESLRLLSAVQIGPGIPLSPGIYRFKARIADNPGVSASEGFRVMPQAEQQSTATAGTTSAPSTS